jgi:hypothetical protein
MTLLFPVLEAATVTSHARAPSAGLEELFIYFLFYVRVTAPPIEAVKFRRSGEGHSRQRHASPKRREGEPREPKGCRRGGKSTA